MDDLFDLNSLEMGQDTSDLEDGSGVDMETDLIQAIPTQDPYWKVSTQELVTFLSLASAFGWKSGRDLTSKSVCLKSEGEILHCYATDFDSYIHYTIPIQTQSPTQANAVLIFPSSTLLKLVRLCGKYTVIRTDPTPSLLFTSQWEEIEALNLSPSSFINSDSTQVQGEMTFPNLAKRVSILSSAQYPKDRSMIFTPTFIHQTYLWSTFQSSIESTLPFSFELSFRDISLLHFQPGSKVTISLTKNTDLPRIQFSQDNLSVLLLFREPENIPTKISALSSQVSVDPSFIEPLTTLSEILPSSSGHLTLAYTQEAGLQLTLLKTSTSPTTYSIPFSQVSEAPQSLPPSKLQAKLLKMAIKTIPSSSVLLSWDSQSFVLQGGDSMVSSLWETMTNLCTSITQ